MIFSTHTITTISPTISPFLAPGFICMAYFIDAAERPKVDYKLLLIIIGLVLSVTATTVLPWLLLGTLYDLGIFGVILTGTLATVVSAAILAFIFPNPQFRKSNGSRTMLFWSFVAALFVGLIPVVILGLFYGLVSALPLFRI